MSNTQYGAMEANGDTRNKSDEKTIEVMDIDVSPLPTAEKQPTKLRRYMSQYAATIIVNFNSFVYGISVAWGSTAIPVLQSKDTPISSGPLSDTHKGWLSANLCLMAFVGVIIFSVLCAMFSRKLVGYLIASLHLSSWIILAFTRSLLLVYVARCLAGIASGASLLYVPLYVSEIAEDSIRGTLGCLMVFIINSGILFGYIIGSYVSYYTQTYIYLTIPASFMVLFLFFPDTPFYLLKDKTSAEAIVALKKLRGGDNADVTEEIARLRESLDRGGTSVSIKTMFASRGITRGMILSIALCTNQQLAGVLAILSFTVQIFNDSGSSLPSSLATIIVGILQLFGTFLSVVLVDRYGRKILLLISNGMVIFELGILGLYYFLKSMGMDVDSWSWIPLQCLSFYIMFFSIGLGPLPFLVMTELLPAQVRSIAGSAGLASLWGVAFIAVLVFNPMINLLGAHGVYWFFTSCCVLGAVFIYFCVPETKGRRIEEITEDLNEGPWILGKKKKLDINPES